ncbi:MAG: histidine phosphatase family protein [Ilumatobacteraceae bacterium]
MLILVRHGRTPANAAGLLQGRLDQDLDEHGQRQAAATAAFVMERTEVDVVIASPLRRAVQTASAFGVEPEIDDRWIELSYGEYEGTPVTGVPSAVWEQWRADPHFVPTGGESFATLHERVHGACAAIVERAAEQNVVVVSHVSPIKSAVAWALDVDPGIAFHSHLDQASVCRIEFRGGRPLLLTFNETPSSPERAPDA